MTLSNPHKRIAFISFLTILLWACGGNGSDPSPVDNGKDRQVILTHWVDNVIIPSYSNFKVKFDAMKVKADAFTSSPSNTTLIEFRSTWVEAYLEWQKVELFEFGPADQNTLRNFFNIYPAEVAGIASNINDPSVNLDLPLSYTRQGFPALDYLINGVGQDDSQILSFYTTETDAAKRIAYVKRLTDRMSTLLTNVISGWSTYRESFISKTGLDIGSSFGAVVNAYVLYYERYIRTGKIGIPSGSTIASTGAVNPDKVEAYYKKDISLSLAKNAHNAALNFFNGKNANTGVEGPSLKSYLDALDAKDASTGTMLSDIVNNQFTIISNHLNTLSENISQQVQSNNQPVVDTYTAMQKLVRIIKVDMTSAMSITITYTDNDGD
jgi:predicted lipoprotein